MRLSEILSAVPEYELLDSGDPEITGVECDSRLLKEGGLFAAVQGEKIDGHDFINNALNAGAAACFIKRKVEAQCLTRVLVPDVEMALGRAAAQFWNNPSNALKLVGITGTNGKTTSAILIKHLFESAGVKTGYLGTVAYSYPSGDEPSTLTTPDAPTIQRAMARMVREGAKALAMEVSSHALERKRLEGCAFNCVAFTNLSRDHLDYHGAMESYFQAKRSLFIKYAAGIPAVVNAEDPHGERLLKDVSKNVISFGIACGDVRFSISEASPKGMRGTAIIFGRKYPAALPLLGEFNASNAACALAVAYAMGIDMEEAIDALSRAPQIPGRLEAIENAFGISVLVDFAHTPDGLYSALREVRRECKGRLLCVFGCGGDRDKSKRRPMAQAAANWCDAIILTADNSRSESTEEILEEIEGGIPSQWNKVFSGKDLTRNKTFTTTPDRREAIKLALNAAVKGDAVVIAGKGHETTQTIGNRVFPFDDRAEAAAALSERASLEIDPCRG